MASDQPASVERPAKRSREELELTANDVASPHATTTPAKPKPKFSPGDFAMIMTSSPTSKLNGLAVTIKSNKNKDQDHFHISNEGTYTYWCSSEEFGDSRSLLYVTEAELRKPTRKVGDRVEVKVRTHGKRNDLEGTVSKIVVENGEFKWVVQLDEVTVEEKSIV